ncbi:ribose 5-phosphate isomerase [Choiromyces venosus 120613-1]|uniref:Ribose-5-phosphate isomerase n=1 Tax=Choiromyces venosus 120613-1 TaxID=1336337 RepID=A0A3N4JTC6_9PEZI|nr:ribose 5-phosphate isomerase [Choiromyces venosus 120613-1]
MRLPINIGRNTLSLNFTPRRIPVSPPPSAIPSPQPPPPQPQPRQFRSFHTINPPLRSPPEHRPNPLYPSPRRTHPIPGVRELSSLSSGEAGKRAAAYAAVDAHFSDAPGYVGIGSGSTVFHVVDRIRQLPAGRVRDTGFVPTGHQSRELLLNAGLRVVRLEDVPMSARISVCFDGADEVDGWLNCIKGGGGCLLLEKLVAIRSEVFVVVADQAKLTRVLLTTCRRGIPIEVIPSATPYVLSELRSLGSTNPLVRDGAPAKLGPCITDNGNFIVDAPFPPLASSTAVVELAESLKGIVGVVEHGIFWRGDRRPEKAFFGGAGGGAGVEVRPTE